MKTNTPSSSDSMLFAGIDFHKRYSVVHVMDAAGATVKKGRIEPNSLAGFSAFFAGFGDGVREPIPNLTKNRFRDKRSKRGPTLRPRGRSPV
jgi:hypothetical protein